MGWPDCLRLSHLLRKTSKVTSTIALNRTEMAKIKEETKDRTRKTQTVKMIITLVMPIICITAMSLASLTSAIKIFRSSESAARTVRFSLKISELVSSLQKERGITTMFLSSELNEQAQDSLSEVRINVDVDLTYIQKFPEDFFATVLNQNFTSLQQLADHIQDYRLMVSSGNISLEQNLYFYTNLTHGLMTAVTAYIIVPPGSALWNRFVAFSSIELAGDAMGIQRALGSSFYAACGLSEAHRTWFMSLEMTVTTNIAQTYKYFPEMRMSYTRNLAKIWPLPNELAKKKDTIQANANGFCQNYTPEEKTEEGLDWFNTISKFISVVENEAQSVVIEMVKGFDENIATAQLELSLYSFAVVATCIVCMISGLCIYHMTGKVQIYAKHITSKAFELQEEKDRTNNFQLQMLPQWVADRIKLGNFKDVEASVHQAVTFYFSDIVDFNEISTTCSPEDVVNVLNTLHFKFDFTIQKYEVYKVETIGDAYIVVSGLKNEKHHSTEIAGLALDLRQECNKLKLPFLSSGKIQLRIGIHSGSCAAGVVGRKLPHYCLFGQTFNMASHMMSTGEALKIHISSATKMYLDEARKFTTIQRGPLVTGAINVSYWLEGRIKESSNQQFLQIKTDGLASVAENIMSSRKWERQSETNGTTEECLPEMEA